MDTKIFIYALNRELFRTAGIITFILYLLETLKDGYVSFFINPAVILVVFVISGIFWLFTPDFGRIEP